MPKKKEEKKPPKQNQEERVNHPSHYTWGKVETIDLVRSLLTDGEYSGYLKGNILKYVHRYEHKNGVEDLEKAQWYLKELVHETKTIR